MLVEYQLAALFKRLRTHVLPLDPQEWSGSVHFVLFILPRRILLLSITRESSTSPRSEEPEVGLIDSCTPQLTRFPATPQNVPAAPMALGERSVVPIDAPYHQVRTLETP